MEDCVFSPSRPPLAELLATAMAQKGYSTCGLAAEVGISSEHVRRYIKGISVPGNLKLKRLCEILGISVAEASKLATAQRIEEGLLRQALRDPECVTICKLWPSMSSDAKFRIFRDAVSSFRRPRSAAAAA